MMIKTTDNLRTAPIDMKKWMIFLYSLAAYLFSLLVQAAFVLFISPWPDPPFHIDTSTAADSGKMLAVLVNLLLLLLFGLQHSIMARQGFKAWLNRCIPAAAERSTYVLMSSIAIAAIVIFWQALPGYLWQVQQPLLWWLLSGLFVFGWIIAVVATFIINHSELFGLQQAWYHLQSRRKPAPVFVERLLYQYVRHPIQLGILIGLWATPVMSLSHALLAVGLSLYIFIGLYYEEKDLVKSLGSAYRDYQQRVAKVVPLPRKKPSDANRTKGS